MALGGLISLFLCGQLGFGLSRLAVIVHHQIMEVAGFLGCTLVCGVLFALVPALTLRLITSSIQFKVLIRHEWKALSGWTLLFGGIIAYMNNDADPKWTLFVWGLAAIGSFELFSNALHKATILWRLSDRTGHGFGGKFAIFRETQSRWAFAQQQWFS